VGEALTVTGPYDERHIREILARLNAIPAILEQAKANLSLPPAPFARMATNAGELRRKFSLFYPLRFRQKSAFKHAFVGG
jgi:hypothetical protein